MKKAFFEDGSIIETNAGKSHFNYLINMHKNYILEVAGVKPRVWFRPCKNWMNAERKFWEGR